MQAFETMQLFIFIFLLSVLVPLCAQLDVDCAAADMDSSSQLCYIHLLKQLNAFVTNDTQYNALAQPLLSDAPMNMSIQMTFNSIQDVDQIAGTVTLSVYLDLLWNDSFISWDPSKVMNQTSADVDPSLVWTPDLKMYNGIDMSLDGRTIYVSSTGAMWWSRSGTITYSCDFNMRWFPYDTQYCTVVWAPFEYTLDVLDISPYDPPVSIASTFKSQAWKVVDVTFERVIDDYYEVGWWTFSFSKFTVILRRHPAYYVNSSLYPILIVTIMTILSMFISDINSRLGSAVTGLLTIIAVQVSCHCCLLVCFPSV
jgi:hypothetical protein